MEALLYCCQSGKRLVTLDTIHFFLASKRELRAYYRKHSFPKELNGTICVSCNIDVVEKINYKEEILDSGSTCRYIDTKTLDEGGLLKASCLNLDAFYAYYPKFALHLSNVTNIRPLKLPCLCLLHNNERGIEPLANEPLYKVPQNMCYAYRFNFETKQLEKILLISIRAENMVNIMNFLKTVETRRNITNKLKELIR